MKKYFLALSGIIIIVASLCCCYGDTVGYVESEPDTEVKYADAETLNGYRLDPQDETESSEKTVSTSGTYYANTKSKIFHIKECAHAEKIKNENLYITSDRNELISGGYRPCKSCEP